MKNKIKYILLLIVSLAYSQNNGSDDSKPIPDTILVNNKKSIFIHSETLDSNTVLLTSTFEKTSTIIDTVEISSLGYIKYLDFDKDGSTDLLIDYISNNSLQELYLFNSGTNNFVKIENFSSFPSSQKLKSNKKYYYSYSRAGCADHNWRSDLFEIINFKIIHLGHIYGEGCGFDNEETYIAIYKVNQNDSEDKTILKKLNYDKYIRYFGDKWNFIHKYWNKNYKLFMLKQ